MEQKSRRHVESFHPLENQWQMKVNIKADEETEWFLA